MNPRPSQRFRPVLWTLPLVLGLPALTAILWYFFGPLLARQTFSGHTLPVDALALSPDGYQVLSGSRDHTARLWDAGSGRELCRFEGHSAAVMSVAFSPDGHRVATGSGDFSDIMHHLGQPGDC